MLLIDSDLLIDAARNDARARAFIADAATHHLIATSTVTRMELLAGCRNPTEWRHTEAALGAFRHLPLTPEISAAALRIFGQYRLSHGTGLADALIAATAIVHAIPLASKNQKHFRAIADLDLIPWPASVLP